jgi:hypothetical protein
MVSIVISVAGLQVVVLGMMLKFAVSWGIFKQTIDDIKADVADMLKRLVKLETDRDNAIRNQRKRW